MRMFDNLTWLVKIITFFRLVNGMWDFFCSIFSPNVSFLDDFFVKNSYREHSMTTWTQFCPFLTTYSPPYGKFKLSVDKNWHFWPPTHLFISTQSLNDPITEKRCKMLNRCFFYSRYQIFEFQVRLNLNNTELFELLKNLMIPHESKLVWIISIFIIIIHLPVWRKLELIWTAL